MKELSTTTPLSRYSFDEIDELVQPFMQGPTPKKPATETQILIDWILRPSPGRQLSFIEVLSLARRYQALPAEKWHLLPWPETAISMTRNDDNVYRLEGRCPHCGVEHQMVRIFFDAPQCAYLRATRGYLYICDSCMQQLHLIRTPNSCKETKMVRKGEQKIDDLPFSVRVRNCLKQAGVETLGELVFWTKKDLEKLRNFGAKCVSEVEMILSENGLSLKQPY